MPSTYQLEYLHAPWHTFRYIIKKEDIPLYQIRRTGLRKYRQFENEHSQVLFYIGATTIKSLRDKQTMASVNTDRKTIETILGNFDLIDLDMEQRSYSLKINDCIVAQVSRGCHLTHEKYKIQLKNLQEQHHEFILAISVLIHSVLDTLQNPIIYPHALSLSKPLMNTIVSS